ARLPPAARKGRSPVPAGSLPSLFQYFRLHANNTAGYRLRLLALTSGAVVTARRPLAFSLSRVSHAIIRADGWRHVALRRRPCGSFEGKPLQRRGPARLHWSRAMIPRKRPWKSWSSKPRGSRPRNPARALLFFFAIVLAASWLAGPQRRTAAAAGQAAGPAVPAPRVIEIPIEGVIQPFLADFVDEALAHAASEHASLVLLTLNTPGGLDTAMRDIIQHIIASPVPVAAYVSPSGSRAASAGFYILLSADVAVMAPGTDTGASSPVFLIGGTAAQVDETLKKKAMNEAAAYLRSICGNRGRNVDLAEKAVTE